MKTVTYTIDDETVTFQVEGGVVRGTGDVLLAADDDVTAGCAWADAGFTVVPFLETDDQQKMKAGFTALIREEVEKLGVTVDEAFTPGRYHEYVDTDEVHVRVIETTRHGFPVHCLPFSLARVEALVSEICGRPLTSRGSNMPSHSFYLRIVRPRSADNNPPHRDVYLDRLRNAVNLYLPVSGSTEKSSLPLLPGSHLWPESVIERTADGARVDGVEFAVPAVTATDTLFAMVRPNPAEGEVLLFSPYLIHGGARNLNEDETRVSLEMRFWSAS